MDLHRELIAAINEELMPKLRTKVEELLPKIPEKVSGEQLAAMLRNNGVSDQEIRWTKLDRLLKQPKITKQEIATHLKQHGLPFDVHDQTRTPTGSRYNEYALRGGRNYGEKLFLLKPQREKIGDPTIKWQMESYKSGSSVKYPEGKKITYVNGFMNVSDDTETTSDAHRIRDSLDADFSFTIGDDGKVTEWTDHINLKDHPLDPPKTLEEVKAIIQKQAVEKYPVEDKSNDYKSGHWGEATNPLFHVRHKEFTDADGKNLWLIEEIQSDWHQAGRKSGYKQEKVKVEVRKVEGKQFPYYVVVDGETEEQSEGYVDEASAKRRAEILGNNMRKGVPDAPMKKSWEEMAFKWALHQAVEAGADRIGWVTGDISAERYDLSKQVDHIRLIYVGEKYQTAKYKMKLVAYKDGHDVLSKDLNSEDELEGMIGKDVAKKLMDQQINNNERELKGEEIKVGGEGMKAAYDQRIVSIAKKVAKQAGAQVGKTSLPGAAPKQEEQEEPEIEPYSTMTAFRLDQDERMYIEEPGEDDEKKEFYVTNYGSDRLAGPFDTEDEAHDARDKLHAEIQRAKKAPPPPPAPEVWYMDITNKVKELVAGGMRATFESKAVKDWWIIKESTARKAAKPWWII